MPAKVSKETSKVEEVKKTVAPVETKSAETAKKTSTKTTETKTGTTAKTGMTAKTGTTAKAAKKSVAKQTKKPAKKGKKEKTADSLSGGEEKGKTTRSFKVIYTDPNGHVIMEGRYCGAKPKQAACKALTGIYKVFKEENLSDKVKDEVRFGVYETTRGSKNKRYWYSGKKSELSEPICLYQIPSADGKKKYCSAEKVKKMGGFDKLFNKKEADVKPAITYNFSNEVSKIEASKCEHLFTIDKVVPDEEPVVVESKKTSSNSKKETVVADTKETSKASKKSATEPAKEATKETVKETTKESAKASTKTSQKEATKEAAKEPIKEAAKETSKPKTENKRSK